MFHTRIRIVDANISDELMSVLCILQNSTWAMCGIARVLLEKLAFG